MFLCLDYPGLMKVCLVQFAGISIDLLYARIAHQVVPEDLDLLEDSILRGTDEQSVRR